MINGHGDDIHAYNNIRCNFSSNIYGGFDHEGLFEHLRRNMCLITNYPEPSPLSLEEELAEWYDIWDTQVMVTNGATEAIYMIARAFSDRQPTIYGPTFAEYADATKHCRGEKTMRWICTPNNPTGRVMEKETLLKVILCHPDDLFVIDASYAAYTDQEILSVEEALMLRNVIMLRSMTKDYGIPGLRLGYIIASERLIERIREYRMPWSVNALAIEAGHYLLAHHHEYKIPLGLLICERRRMERELQAMGITTHRSDSHMLLCRLPHGTAAALKNHLIREHGILIRDASNFNSLTPQHFRIAVQTPEHNSLLLNALSQWI